MGQCNVIPTAYSLKPITTINPKPHTLTEARVPKSALADGEVASDSAVETGLMDLFRLTVFTGNLTFCGGLGYVPNPYNKDPMTIR